MAEAFAYRTELGAAVLVLAGTVALLVALATVAYNASAPPGADPVRSLRSE